jgi:hypothetical protein
MDFLWILLALLFLVNEGCLAMPSLDSYVPTFASTPTLLSAFKLGPETMPASADMKCQHATCQRVFQQACHLRRHYQCSGHGPSKPVGPKKKKRCNYSYRRKRDMILELDALKVAGEQFPTMILSHRTGIHESLLSKWNNARCEVFSRARVRGKAGLQKWRKDGGRHGGAEAQLYGLFVWRRKYLRLMTSHTWLRETMQDILATHGVLSNPSPGWSVRFCARWQLSYQCRTNKHKVPVHDRLPEIRNFHTWLIYGLQRSEPQRCPKYGRFPPHLMYHMDQVPLAFSPGSKRTMNMINEPCEMAEPGGSGATKRFCTLQVCICAQADQQRVNIEIYFRGQGLHLSQEEKDCYAALPNINVRFQRKAWVDEVIAMEWLEYFRKATLDQGEVLLGMDNHSSQRTPMCESFMDLMQIVPAYTPANCTDCTSPVDRNVGQAIKLKIAKRYHATYRANKSQWELPKREGGLSNSRKRMLCAQWASEAWAEFCLENQECIRRAFVGTGFLLAKDGSENHEVTLWKKKKSEFASVGPDGQQYTF